MNSIGICFIVLESKFFMFKSIECNLFGLKVACSKTTSWTLTGFNWLLGVNKISVYWNKTVT